MDTPKLQDEHRWLRRLLGHWTFEGECFMGPDQPSIKSSGQEMVEPLGDLWTIGRMSGEMPSGGMCHSVITLGFDPRIQRFVGTFITEMMSHQWVYNGTLDSSANTLILDTEGPSFSEDGKTARYQDIIEFIDDNHRIFRSQLLGPDGQWVPFMKSMFTRSTN